MRDRMTDSSKAIGRNHTLEENAAPGHRISEPAHRPATCKWKSYTKPNLVRNTVLCRLTWKNLNV